MNIKKLLLSVLLAAVTLATPHQAVFASQKQIQYSNTQELAYMVQHFASISYSIIHRITKDKTVGGCFSQKDEELVHQLDTSYPSILQKMRIIIYQKQDTQKAIMTFGDYIHKIAQNFGISTHPISFSSQSSETNSEEKNLALIKKTLQCLEVKFSKIKPSTPLLTRIKNRMLYNHISTNTIPSMIKWIVPALTFIGLYGGALFFGLRREDKATLMGKIADPSKNAGVIVCSIIALISPCFSIPISKEIGNFMKNAQMPTYEKRTEEKKKLLEEKKIQQEMQRYKINYEKEICFNQIRGLDSLIDNELRVVVDYLKNPLRYTGGTKSLLFYGPPGTGKTLLARAIAKESGAPILEITADDILGETAREKIIATIRLAENTAIKRPEKSAIIYIDEIDTVTGNREKGLLDPQRAKALSNLLAIFDGIEKRNPFLHIAIILTTNRYDDLDPALLRPGRIDRKYLIGLPNEQARAMLLDKHLPNECKQYLSWLIQETEGYSGAQIVNLIDTALMIASYNNRFVPIEQDYKIALKNSKLESNKALS